MPSPLFSLLALCFVVDARVAFLAPFATAFPVAVQAPPSRRSVPVPLTTAAAAATDTDASASDAAASSSSSTPTTTREKQPSAMKPKQIINDPKDSVDDFIAGLLLQYPNRLEKLQNHHVVLAHRNAAPGDRVQILSGGGSGHEPSHAGWIGTGMLTGAVCGGIFASPSVAAILAAIRACGATQPADSKKGVLLVVKNYTGDRLNFGMACERANQEGIPCRMVVIADDCAVARTKGITGARGVAGTVLVHKIAGAAAEQGRSLDEIVALVNDVTSRMGTLGVALDSVTVPGAAAVNDRLSGADLIELGLGIHGEAGMKQLPIMTADDMAKRMIETIQDYGRIQADSDNDNDSDNVVPLMDAGDDLCVLVNNLGGTSNFEMSILANSAVKILETEYRCKVSRLMVGSYMTSFNMHGASITILNLSKGNGNGDSDELVGLLDADTDAPAWIACDVVKDGSRPSDTERPETVPDTADGSGTIDIASLPPVSIDDFGAACRAAICTAATALRDAEPELTKFDTIVGDGDCGITMKRGAAEVLERLEGKNETASIRTEHPVPMMADMADAVSASMGGTSGVLLELMFRKMSSTLATSPSIGPAELAAAFQAGTDAIGLYGGASAGSRTMLDALIPAAAALVETNVVADAATKAREGADGTAKMTAANAGRSNYLSAETLEGTPDPGAVAVAIVLEALTRK